MKALFWLCALMIRFAYPGYPALLFFRTRFWPRPARPVNIFPLITILLAGRNEEENQARNYKTWTDSISQQTRVIYWLTRLISSFLIRGPIFRAAFVRQVCG